VTAIFYTALKYGAFVRRKDGRIDKPKGTAHRDNLSGSRDERSLCLGDDDDGDPRKAVIREMVKNGRGNFEK